MPRNFDDDSDEPIRIRTRKPEQIPIAGASLSAGSVAKSLLLVGGLVAVLSVIFGTVILVIKWRRDGNEAAAAREKAIALQKAADERNPQARFERERNEAEQRTEKAAERAEREAEVARAAEKLGSTIANLIRLAVAVAYIYSVIIVGAWVAADANASGHGEGDCTKRGG